MAVGALYIHNGNSWVIQNNNACKKLGDRSECEIFAHNGSGWEKIYPREQGGSTTQNDYGGISCYGVRQQWGNNCPGEIMQGWVAANGKGGRVIGYMWWNNGKPLPSGRLISVNKVEISLHRTQRTGYNRRVTGMLGVANSKNAKPSAVDGYIKSHPRAGFTIGAWDEWYTATSDSFPGLKDVVYSFLTSGDAQALVTYNDETSRAWTSGSESGSANYFRATGIRIKIEYSYEP